LPLSLNYYADTAGGVITITIITITI